MLQPPDEEAALAIAPSSHPGRYWHELEDGRVDVTFGGARAHQDIIGKSLSLTPYETASGTISWRCGAAPAPAGNLIVGGDDHQAPTVDTRYLPAVCRQ